jgi:hypothetical protein
LYLGQPLDRAKSHKYGQLGHHSHSVGPKRVYRSVGWNGVRSRRGDLLFDLSEESGQPKINMPTEATYSISIPTRKVNVSALHFHATLFLLGLMGHETSVSPAEPGTLCEVTEAYDADKADKAASVLPGKA